MIDITKRRRSAKRRARRRKIFQYQQSIQKVSESIESAEPIEPIELIEPIKYDEEDSEYYDEHVPEDLNSNIYWQKLYNKVVSLLPSEDFDVPIMELGCGPGFFAKTLFEKGYRNYCGVDFSPVCIEQAIERVSYPFKFVVGNLYDEEIQNTFVDYDIFICLETLEHLENDLTVLEAIPSGRKIILSVPNFLAQGHVRMFGGQEEVRLRYESLINFDEIMSIYRGRRKIYFFLAYGTRK